MALKLYEGIFHTKGMEKSMPDYEEWSQADKDRLQKAFELLDEKPGYVTRAYDNDGYHFIGCEDGEIAKEFMWLMELDDTFGQYSEDEREKFDSDWENDTYYPDCSISIMDGYFEIARELNG